MATCDAGRLNHLRDNCPAGFHGRSVNILAGGWTNLADERTTKPYNGSCPFLKASYNCDSDGRSPRADQWAWVVDASKPHSTCVLPRTSPASVSDLRNSGKSAAHEPSRPLRLLWLGDSLVRQVFEAFLCANAADLTGGVRLTGTSPFYGGVKHLKQFNRTDLAYGTLPSWCVTL